MEPTPSQPKTARESNLEEIAKRKEITRRKIKGTLEVMVGVVGADLIFNKFFEGNEKTLNDLMPEERTEMGRLIAASVEIELDTKNTENKQECDEIFKALVGEVYFRVAEELKELGPQGPDEGTETSEVGGEGDIAHEPEPAPIVPPSAPVVETLSNTEVEKAERIRVLREKIAANIKTIAELKSMLLAIPDEPAASAPLAEKLDTSPADLERQIELKEDREKNPFKYHLLDKLNPKNFQVMFMADRKNISVKQINEIMGEDGRDFKSWDPNFITTERDNAITFSSNGFYLRLKNREEIRGDENGKKVLMIYGPKARYDLVGPDGRTVDTNLDYQTGDSLFYKKTTEYQEEQLAEFTKLTGPK